MGRGLSSEAVVCGDIRGNNSDGVMAELKRKRGARINANHDADSRARIQASQLVNRLTSFVNGEIELVPAQVTAALGLLRKTLPDLTSVEQVSEITHHYVARVPAPHKSIDEWQQHQAAALTPQTVQ